MATVQIEGLCKAFRGSPVLRGVAMSVAAGRLVAVLGTSGSGKTTLLRLLCGFERADAGSIRIGEQTVAADRLHLAPERRRIGYVAQEGALFPHLSVSANVLFGLAVRGRRAQYQADEYLRMVGLSAAYANRWPHELSGGEQQRVALARALAPRPSLVLLDEPFSALDAALRLETRNAVAGAIAAAGATALLVTHDQSEALSMGHQVGVLRDGRLIQFADPQTLYRRPVDAALAGFVGEAVLLDGIAVAGEVTCALGRLALNAQAAGAAIAPGAVTVMIRPEQIRASPDRKPGAQMVGEAHAVTFFGPDATVQFRLPGGTMVLARMAGHAAPAPGTMMQLTVEGAVMAFPPGQDEPGA